MKKICLLSLIGLAVSGCGSGDDPLSNIEPLEVMEDAKYSYEGELDDKYSDSDKINPSIKGPTSPPVMKGPSTPPPSR